MYSGQEENKVQVANMKQQGSSQGELKTVMPKVVNKVARVNLLFALGESESMESVHRSVRVNK